MSSNSKVRELYPRPQSIEELTLLWNQMFKDKTISRAIIETGQDFILIERDATPEESAEPIEKQLYIAIRNNDMEEFEIEDSMTPHRVLFDVIRNIEAEGLKANYIIAGSKTTLSNWLNTKITRNTQSLFGINLLFSTEIPAETLIVCGAEYQDANPKDVKFSIKVDMS